MANHGLLFNNRDSFERYPEFKEEVFQIIEAPAVKNPEPSSEKKFNITHQEYERSNENTFFHVAMPILMKDGHFVLEDGKAAYKDFLVDEGIRVNIDREFRGMLLPHRYRDPKFDKELSEALRKNDGMKNSKPDWCMGMSLRNCRKLAADRTAMPTPLPSHLSNLLTISQEMYHPFFLAEAKADGRPTADAVDQARCGGATIVNADCVLTDLILHEWEPRSYETEKQPITHARQHVTKPVQNPAQSLSTGAMQSGQIEDQQVHPMLERPLGADPHTMIFSATVKPDLVTVYVHWRERVLFPDGTIDSLFHMNTVFSQSNHDERRALRDIRRVFHNIIKWGIGPRLDEHLEMWDGIREYAVWYQTEELPRQLELQKGNKKAQARGKKRAFESDEASVAAKKVLLEVNLEENLRPRKSHTLQSSTGHVQAASGSLANGITRR
ncbi:uncharacterized protein KY384_008055 [Bacidia gigantensis]|uniref:uncharacterized protein n=1 Tax=Bacidia gigantensis TaxID=2732470 RepID=UPI001D04915B|nr:uncharacterized protein KY384_008055 [Bacidia gigantensis]KAG8527311.1 hypothetical protein KY384_008055 [Bacidia gigantensis]